MRSRANGAEYNAAMYSAPFASLVSYQVRYINAKGAIRAARNIALRSEESYLAGNRFLPSVEMTFIIMCVNLCDLWIKTCLYYITPIYTP